MSARRSAGNASRNLRLIVLAAIAALSPHGSAADSVPAPFRKNARVLFQGDSITDASRGTDDSHRDQLMGDGYVHLIAADCGGHHPELGLAFFNRGRSGNKVADLAARWQADTIDLKPDVVSILVGVNDVWLNLRDGREIRFEEIEKTYDGLLAGTLSRLPGVRVVLCEPFIEPGFETNARWNEWEAAIRKMQLMVGRLGAKYSLPVVHFQRMFDDACKRAPAKYWIFDGVHPVYAGQQLMADEWLRAVKKAWQR